MIDSFLIAAAVVVVSYLLVRRFESLKTKSDDELYKMLEPGSDERFHPNVLRELQRRGRNIEEYAMGFLHMMVSESQVDRGVGWALLKEIYPKLAARISFDPYEDLDTCKSVLTGIFNNETIR